MTRVIGPPKSRRRKWTFLWALAIAVGLSVLFIPGALAVHDTGAFELDGNATSLNAPSPEPQTNDWDRVCHEALKDTTSNRCGTTSNTGAGGLPAATAVAWTGDCLNSSAGGYGCGDLSATTFTGGGSKDPLDISGWAWVDGGGGLPAKDNLEHAFAARFSLAGTTSAGTCPNGTDLNGGSFNSTVPCQVIFFGSDRYDNSGDAQQGFWFFQNQIALNTNKVGGGQGFSGVHKNGDVLVTSDFSVGGTTSTISVYKWDSTCLKAASKPGVGDCFDTNLRLLETSTNAKCDPTLTSNDGFCGIVNTGTTTPVPWSGDYKDKSGNSTTYLPGELYEGGINLSTLGLGNECFSTVGSETRSSATTSAVLEDFVLSQFAQCGASLTTTPSGNGTLSGGSATVSDSAAIKVTGTASPPAPTGSVSFYLCGPSATALTSCDATGTSEGSVNLSTATQSGNTFTVGSGNVTVNASGYYCWFATWPGDSNYIPPSGSTAFSDGSSTECFQITQPTSVLTTLHETNSSGADVSPSNNHTSITINAGGYVVDYATVSPSSATGTVIFRYFTDQTVCNAATKTGGNDAGSGSLSSGSAHGSTLQLTAGTYYFRAFYQGDGALNLPSSSDCSETLTVNQPTSVLTTLHETNSSGADVSPSNNHTSITINTNGYVVDYATVSPSSATGTVIFRYFTDQTVCNAATKTGGNDAGSGSLSSGSAHGSTLQLTAGTYYFRAFYQGDGALNLPSSSDCSETLTVNQPTSVLTTLHETNSSGADVSPSNNHTSITINAGGYVVDYATVSPSSATGTVIFRYFTDQTVCNAADKTGGNDAGSGSLSSGSAHGSTLQLTAGTYYFRAFYQGDGALNLPSSSDCSETLTVNQFQPTLNTAQTVTVTDKATISDGGGGGNLTGTAFFQPFSDSSCTAANALATQESVAVSGASPQTATMTTHVTLTASGTVYWKVSYTSTNPAQKSIAATCTENSSITINN